MKKRTWHYICNPWSYEITCDRCGGHNIEWSEYEHMIWWYNCQVDTHGTEGIFDGPIPFELMKMLGSPLDRWNMETQQVEYIHIIDGHVKWLPEKDDNAKQTQG